MDGILDYKINVLKKSSTSVMYENKEFGYPYVGRAILKFIGDPQRSDILSFARGEELIILGEFQSGWLIAKSKNGNQQGFVQHKYMARMKSIEPDIISTTSRTSEFNPMKKSKTTGTLKKFFFSKKQKQTSK
eukprot:TRINITY_DN9058_c0_g1_i1.p1 TRINITY_DN9058_c0_g1~~TRINITY_DN9058_c0_g1_i1.p1  ORF type:complete len:132 (-),score=15.47 TRINITY_DN9058_c0_g1_i1:75-470(-)